MKAGVTVSVGVAMLLWPLIVFAEQVSQQESQQELTVRTWTYTPSESTAIRQNVSEVVVDVVVWNQQQKAVGGLTRSDFRLYDNGKQQSITEFEVENMGGRPGATAGGSASPATQTGPGMPRGWIALFFDDRHLTASDLDRARLAAEKFVREKLPAADEVGVFTASGLVAQDFTTDASKVLGAIESLRLQTLPNSEGGAITFSPCTAYPMGPWSAYLILDSGDTEAAKLYSCGERSAFAVTAHAESVLSFAEVVSKDVMARIREVIARLAQVRGQRTVVVISDGFFATSLGREKDEMAQDALRAGVVVDSLNGEGLAASNELDLDANPRIPVGSPYEESLHKTQRQELADVLEGWARDTGGIYFHNNNDLAAGLQEFADVPAVSYRLAFSPPNPKDNGDFHHLKVKVAAHGSFRIQARQGYYAPTPQVAKKENIERAFLAEVLGTDQQESIPVQVGAESRSPTPGAPGIKLSMGLSPLALSFQKEQGRHVDKVEMVGALFGQGGSFVAGQVAVLDMNLDKETLSNLIRNGVHITLALKVPRGHYRLRFVLVDTGSGKMFATTLPAEIS
jgi:VWFA-related protein